VNSWKVILATMVIFGAGVITGGLLVRHTGGGKPGRSFRPSSTNAAAQNFNQAQMQRMEFLIRANRELELTPEQRERIERILREGQEKTRKLWEGVAPEMRKELQLVRERIKVELTSEQRKRFEELLRRPRPGPGALTNESLRLPRRDNLPPREAPAGESPAPAESR
jgi:hypothetical protein